MSDDDPSWTETKRRDALAVLQVGAPVLAVYYAVLVAGHALVLAPDIRAPMMGIAVLTSLASAALAAASQRRPQSIERVAVPTLTALCALAAVSSGAHVVLSAEPIQSTSLMLVAVASGLVLRSRIGLSVILALLSGPFVFMAARSTDPLWMHFGFALLSAYAIALTLFILRTRALRELYVARCAQQRTTDELHAAVVRAQLSERRYRTLIDRCPDAVFIIDAGRVQYMNPAAEVLLDLRETSIIGVTAESLCANPKDPCLGDAVERLTLLDAQAKAVEVSAATTEVELEGRPVQVVFARDVRSLVTSEQLQSQFLSTVSHELRTPLTSIIGALGLLETPEKSERQSTLLALASRNAHRLNQLIEDLLHLRAPEELPSWAPVQLGEVVLGALTVLPEDAYVHHIDDALWVMGDRDGLARVVRHLVTNAMKFGPGRVDVEVCVRAMGDRACIHVSDRGPGVPRRFREAMFDGFSQERSGLDRPHNGAGVGLAVSRRIVERHGGRLTLHDRDGGGATITVSLPLERIAAG